MKLYLVVFAYWTALAVAQDVLTVLKQQANVTQFAGLLAQYGDLVDILNTGGHTRMSLLTPDQASGILTRGIVLIPTDSAVATARSQNPQSFVDSGSTRAWVEYHALLGTHPSASVSNTSQFVPTLLNNTFYTNVTGGQRVELVENDGPMALSALKAESRIIQRDIFYVGGLMHIVDNALQIPLSFPATVTKGNLTYIVALLNKGNLLTPNSVAYKVAIETPDLTFLGPNNPEYGNDFTGWDGLSQDQLNSLFLYHAIPELVYTTSLKNNSQLITLANTTVTARTYTSTNQSATFFDQGHVTISNYLTSNGVLQVIDRPLNLSTPNAAPSTSDINAVLGIPTLPAKKGVSSGAVAGIVIGVLALLTLLSVAFIFWIRHRRTRGRSKLSMKGAISSATYRQQPPDYHQSVIDEHKAHDDGRSTRTPSLSSPVNNKNTVTTTTTTPPPNKAFSNRPSSFARSIRGAFFPARVPTQNLVELDASARERQSLALAAAAASPKPNKDVPHATSSTYAANAGTASSRPPVTCASSIYSVAEGRFSLDSVDEPVPPLPTRSSHRDAMTGDGHEQTSFHNRVSMPLDAEMLKHIVYHDKE